MAVRLRLSRIGKKHVPFNRIVAVDSRKKRDGKVLENLGTYDVLKSKLVTFHQERFDYWISCGAIPTDSVKKIQKTYKKSLEVPAAPKKKVVKKAVKKNEEPKPAPSKTEEVPKVEAPKKNSIS